MKLFLYKETCKFPTNIFKKMKIGYSAFRTQINNHNTNNFNFNVKPALSAIKSGVLLFNIIKLIHSEYKVKIKLIF